MNFYTTMQFITMFLISFFVGLLIYLFSSKDVYYLSERLKKGHVVVRKKNFINDLLKIMRPLTQANMKGNRNKDAIKKMFIKLGMPATEADIMDFENKRMLFFFIAVLICIIVSVVFVAFSENMQYESRLIFSVFIVCFPSFIVYKLPIWKLMKKIKQKEKAFEKYFPDAIDLLCVCVEAGLNIDGAIERVGKEFRNFSYEVGYEFNRIAKDMLSGVSKQDALRGLAERVENKDIKSFVAIIIQAEKMGSSISSSLSVCADSLRTKRKQRLEKLVNEASIKMTVPLVLFLLPATFIVVLAPTIIKIMEKLGNGLPF